MKSLFLISICFLTAVSAPIFAWAIPAPLNSGHDKLSERLLIREIKIKDYLKDLEPDQIVEKIDSQGKGKPDIFIVYNKKEDRPKTLAMQLFDLNRDGKIDLVKFYDKERLIRTESDLDFDGVVDLVTEYDPVTGDVRKKIQADSSTNIWSYYFKKELKKKEIDRNFDGKPDMWVYYRNGRPYRTEIDRNFDGKVVQVSDKELMNLHE